MEENLAPLQALNYLGLGLYDPYRDHRKEKGKYYLGCRVIGYRDNVGVI